MALGRKTGGRKKGVPNKASIARQKAVADSGLTPLDYMLSLLQTEETPPALRFEAAKAAAPYIHPKLSNVELGNKDGKPFQVTSVASDKKLLWGAKQNQKRVGLSDLDAEKRIYKGAADVLITRYPESISAEFICLGD